MHQYKESRNILKSPEKEKITAANNRNDNIRTNKEKRKKEKN